MTTKKLTILATSDIHGKLYPYDYILNQEDRNGSMAQLSTCLKEQYHSEDTFLVDAGDVIQGNHAELFQQEPIHPMVQAMNDFHYDIHVIGNHDIDFGMDVLQTMIHTMNGTVLTGNIYDPTGKSLAPGYQILTKNGIRVAFIGMTTPLVQLWTAKQLEGCTVTSAVEETRKIIDSIKGSYDLLVGVFHMAVDNELCTPDTGVTDLANVCPEFDLIISSHAHKLIEAVDLNGILTVQNASKAKSLIRIEFELEETDNGYQCVRKTSKAILTKDYEPDQAFLNAYLPYHLRQIEDISQVIGTLEGSSLAPDNELPWMPQSLLQPTALLTLIHDTMIYFSGARVSAAPLLTAAANLQPGPIHKYDLSKIFKYNNDLCLIELNGKQLRQYMEWSCQFFQQWKPGDLSWYTDDAHPMYNYDMFYGVNYEVDISKPAGSRITNLTWTDGTPVQDEEVFSLCTTSFRTETVLTRPGEIYTEDQLPVLLEAEIHNELGTIRELIGYYIQDVMHGILTSRCEDNWELIGTDWDEELHEKALELLKEDILKPEQFLDNSRHSKPITIDDIQAYLDL